MSTNNPSNPDPATPPQTAPADQAPPESPAVSQTPDDDYHAFQTAFSGAQGAQQAEPSAPTEQFDQQPQPNPYLEQARELGFDFGDDATPEEIFQTVADRYQQIQPYAQYGQSLMPHAQQISDLLAQQQQPQQPQQQDEPEWSPENYFKEKWAVPEWKQQYDTAIQNGMVGRNPQTGLFEAARGYEAMVGPILPGLNEAHQFQAQKWQSLMRGNPYENFYETLREPLQRQWSEDIRTEIQRQFGRQQRMSSVQQFEQENAGWMYQQDRSGNYVPTEVGAQFLGNVKMLRDSGMRDTQQIIQVAKSLTGQLPQQQDPQAPEGDQHPTIPFPQQQQPAPQQPQQKQSPQKTFLQNALDRAGHSPQSGANTPNSPDVPVQMSQGDWDHTFTNAFRAKQGRAS